MTQGNRVFAATGAFVFAVLSYSKLLFQDPAGRLLVGTAWLVAAIGWTLQYLRVKRSDAGERP